MSKRTNSAGPTRQSDSLADVVEMLLDKGVVINADIVVSIGDTELLGVQLRAAIASFETAAEYGLEFPEGTDMRRVEEASGRSELPEDNEESDTVQTAVAETGETTDEDVVKESADGQSDTRRQSSPELGGQPNTEVGTQARETEESGDEADGEDTEEEQADDDG
jgi:hypothetical protein